MPDIAPKTSSDELDDLTRLAIRHGTDKWGGHFYAPVYHRLFSSLRDRPIRLLEIGVGGYGHSILGGASLAMWADYFPCGEITGLDIEEKRLTLGERVKIYRGSQVDAAFLARVNAERGPFDIVIDDGSHVPQHVVASFNHLFPLLADGGWYVIEDVQTTYWPSFGGSALRGGETMRLARSILDWLHHAEIRAINPSHAIPAPASQIKAFHAFHNILAVEKGDNSEPSNAAYDGGNPHVVRAIGMIERELAERPTGGGLANLASLHQASGANDKARAIIDEGLARWPNDAALLSVALGVVTGPGDRTRRIDCLDRLLRLEPGNEVWTRALAEARNAAE